MSMFNFDGQLVAGALHAQQAGEVITDILYGRREGQEALTAAELHQQLLALHQRYGQLVGRYNNLADRYNGVLADNKRVDAAHAATIAEKDRRIAELAAEKEESRKSAYEGWSKHWEALDEIERLKIKAGKLPPEEHKSADDL